MFSDIRAVVLDRDGVINVESTLFIKSPEEWIPLPGAIESIARLSQSGIRVAVCSNQSGLGRGLIKGSAFSAIHRKFFAAVESAGGKVDLVRFCPHSPDAKCLCRKPSSAMLEDICRYMGLPIEAILMVGDSSRDIESATTAGCPSALVLTGNGRSTKESGISVPSTFEDLQSLVDQILRS